MSGPSLTQIEYFVAVARAGSFRRAAEELGVTQPTLTAQIARLERELSLCLLERGRSGARLTPAGRQLHSSARLVLESLTAFRDGAELARAGNRGIYRLGVKTTVGPYVLPQILPELQQRHPDLRLYIREDAPRRLEEGLERGDYDLVMTSLPLGSTDTASTQLMREAIRLVVPQQHPLAARNPLCGSDLRGQPILTTEEGHLFSRQIEAACERLGARLLRDYQGTSLDALRLMVGMGMGLAFLPALYIHSEIRDDTTLQVCELSDESLARIHVLAWRPGSPARGFYRQLAVDIREILSSRLGSVVTVLKE